MKVDEPSAPVAKQSFTQLPVVQNRAPASIHAPFLAVPFEDRNRFAPFQKFEQSPEPDFSHYTPPVNVPVHSEIGSVALPHGNNPVAYRSENTPSKSNEKKAVSTDSVSPSVPLVGNIPSRSTASTSNQPQYQSPSSGTIPASAPQQLIATAHPNAVDLTWNPASGSGVTYTVQRSTDSSTFDTLASGLTQTHYLDSSVTDGVEYFYRVRSQNSVGGSQSPIVSAIPSNLPSVPLLTALASNASVSLNWSNSTGTGPITYSVERSLTAGSGYSIVSSGLSSPVFSDLSVTNGTLYYYRVQAHNIAGNSNYSAEIQAKPVSSFLTGSITPAGSTSAVLTWNSAAGASRYDVKYGTTSGTYTTTVSNQTSPATLTGLTPGTLYYFSVQASNSQNGSTLSSNEISATLLGGFSITSLTPSSSDKLTVAWGASAGATSYDVQCGTSSGNYSVTLANQTSPATLSGLSSGTPYYCVVVAKNTSGSLSSAEVSTSTLSLPTTPSLTALASNASVSLNWTSSTGTGTMTYSVERSLTAGSGFSAIATGLPSLTYTDTSVTNGTLYYYRVQAHNVAGDSSYSTEVLAKPIASFSLASVTPGGSTSAVLTWNSATGASQYDVRYGTSSGTYTTTLSNQTSPTTITGLTAGTTYFFSVRASNIQNGLTLSSNELSVTLLGGFSITSLTPSNADKLIVTWGASAGATSYDVKCGTSSGSYSVTLTNQTSPATVSGLSSATPYYCVVVAKNTSGSLTSAEASATTLSLPTTPSLTALASNASVSLSWTSSTGTSPITYSVERSLTSGSGFSVITSGLSSPFFSDSSVTNGTLYYYRVQAHNPAGDSTYSAEIAAKPISSFLLGTATAGQTSVVLTWNSATGASQYDVKYGTASGTYTTTLSNQTSPATISGLTAGTLYYFSVQASNTQNGATISTNELSATPLGAFSITSITATDIGKLNIAWSASTGATSYDVKCGTSSGSYSITLTNKTSPTTVTGLSNGTPYYCVVVAKNTIGSLTSIEVSTSTLSLLTYTWPFDAGTDSSYTFDVSKLELVGGVSRLRSLSPSDASYVGGDFKDGTFSSVKWSSSKLVLDSNTSDGELSAQWTPKYNQIVGYWKLNGTAGASIAAGDVVYASIGSDGIAQNANGIGLHYTTGKQRQGIQFDGVDDSVILGTSANYALTTGFTLSTWVQPNSITGSTQFFVSEANAANNAKYFSLAISSTGNIQANLWDVTGASQGLVTNPATISSQQWYHVTYIYDGSQTKLYVNGKLVDSKAYSWSNPSVITTVPLQLGARTGTSSYFNGRIDETAIWNTALSDSEVKTLYERQNARYTGTFLSRVMDAGGSTSWTGLNFLSNLPFGNELPSNQGLDQYYDPSYPFTSLLAQWHLDETSGTVVADSSGNSLNATASNVTMNVAGITNKAMTFNGTSSYINVGTASNLNIGTSDWSVSSWFKTTSTANQSIIAKSKYGAAAGRWALNIGAISAGAVDFMLDFGSGGVDFTAPGTWNDGNWHHVAVTLKRSGSLHIYIDGNDVYSSSISSYSAQNWSTSFPTLIGAYQDTTGTTVHPTIGYFNGSLDEVAVWNRELTASEVQQILQTRPLMFGNVGLWHMNETTAGTAPGGKDFADSSGMGKHGTNSGATLGASGKLNTGISNSSTGAAALPVDLSTTKVMSLSFWYNSPAYHAAGSGNSSILLEFTPDMNTSNGFVIATTDCSSGSPCGSMNLISHTSSGYKLVYGNNLTTPGWHHYVAVVDRSVTPNQLLLYQDGVLYLTSPNAGLNVNSSGTFGNSNLYLFARNLSTFREVGSLDEIAIWNRKLSLSDVQQLYSYQRGANRLKFQVRSCSSPNCSDDLNQANWKGSDGTNNTYLTDLNNSNPNSTSLSFSTLGFSLPSNQYFQYRAIFESDNTTTSPELTSVSAGPNKFDGSNPTLIPINGPNFQIYTGLTTTLGASCAGVPKLQLSHDKSTWYYYSTGMWNTATAGITQANDTTTINSNISTFNNVAGTGPLYVKVFYPSNTTTACEIDSISVAGADTNSNSSSNPTSFTITSATGGDGSASLNWSTSTGATSYAVCFGTSQSAADACGNYVTVTGTSTTINGLTNNTTYYFDVIASTSGGRTPASTSASATPMALPAAPTSLVATSSLYTIQLNWTAAPGNVTYTVNRSTTPGGPYTTLASGLVPTAFTDYTALAGTNYYYVVTATNSGGTSAKSNEANATSLGSFSITSATGQNLGVTLNWSTAVGASSYSISYGTQSGIYSTTLNNQTSPTTISGLSATTRYYFLVTAKSTLGATSSTQEVNLLPAQNFTYDWPFTNGTDSSYSFNSSIISLANNACRLTPTNWTDNDDVSAGFAGGNKYGVQWSSNNLVLGSTLSQKALNAGWTPKYASLVHYWNLDGTSGASIAAGSTLNDSVGTCQLTANNANGTGFGFINAPVSTGVNFDGVDDSLNCSSGAWNPGTSNFTFSYWFKAPSGYLGRPLSKRNTTSYGSFFTTNIISGKLQLELDQSSSGDYVLFTGNQTIDDNVWHQATYVRNGTTLSIYIDGKLDNTTTSSIQNISNGAGYEMNSFAAASITYPAIKLDEVAIWSAALSADEIKVIYDHQLKNYAGTVISRVFDAGQITSWPGLSWTSTQIFGEELTTSAGSITSGLLGIWHLNETSSGTAPGGKDFKDSSANGYHASASGSFGYGQAGKFNQAVASNSGNQIHIDFPTNTFSGGVATVSFWMNWKGGADVMPVGFAYYDIYMNNGKIGFNSAAADIYGFNSATLLNRWVHVVAEFHAGNYNLNKIYIDGVSQTLTQQLGSMNAGLTYLSDYVNINGWSANGSYRFNDGTLFDEVAVWNRVLTTAEVKQLYQSASAGVKFQLRSCTASDCSDDTTASNWKGPDGTSSTYYVSPNNTASSAIDFAASGITLPNTRYLQYKLLMQSEQDPTTLGPNLQSVTLGPIYDSTAPAIYTLNGSAYLTLTGFNVTLGSNGCSDIPKFQFSKDKSTWYYYNGSNWVTATNSYTQASTAAVINSNISTLPSVIGTGTIYVRSYLNSTGAHPCEVDNINVTGTN